MISNCALIALTAPSSGRRCCCFDAIERGCQGREPVRDPRESAAHLDQRDGQHGDDDHRQHRPSAARAGACCSCVTEPVGQRVHVAVLDDGLVDDQAEHRRRRLELGDVRGVAERPCPRSRAARSPTSRCCRRSPRARSAGRRRPARPTSPMPSAMTQYVCGEIAAKVTVISRPPPSAGIGRHAGSGRRSR